MKSNRMTRFLIIIFLGISVGPSLLGQDEPSEPLRTRMSLDYYELGGEGKQLKATVNAKMDRSYERVPNVEVHFFTGDEDLQISRIGTAISDERGVATISVPEIMLDTFAKWEPMNFYATTDASDLYRACDKSVSYLRTMVDLVTYEEDSTEYVQFRMSFFDEEGNTQPAENVPARFFIQRMFGLLPISEEFEETDESGLLTIEFPNDIPGDKEGMLTVLAKIDDHESYGNVILEKNVAWGLPLTEKADQGRQLWGGRDNAPIYLIVFANALIIGVWGLLISIIISLFRIKSLGRA